MAVTPAMIKELRERTSAGMSDCKNALTESEGDIEKAVEIILKKGIVKGAARAGKIAAEGESVAVVAADKKKGVILEVNCQTDFVARGDEFKTFVKNVATVAAGLAKGADLSAQKYPGTDKTIEEARIELAGKTGENMVVRRWDLLEATGEGIVHAYNHNGRVAVLVAVEAPAGKKDDTSDFKPFVENVAMQVAAMSPLVVDKSQVNADQIAKQKEIYAAQMKLDLDEAVARLAELDKATDLTPEELAAEKKGANAKKGPPEAMWPKVIDGKVTKWFTEVTLLGQDNVWDPGAGSIDKVRGELGKKLGGEVKITGFVRFGLGDGIEKKSEDLAAEVAKTIGA